MTALEVRDVAVSYGTHQVLFDAALTVKRGTMTCILGPSGCGKTTLLRAIAGFEPVQHGSISINQRVVDDAITRLAPERRRVGYVPQEGALFPHLDVVDNIGFAIPHRTRQMRASRQRRIDELLDLVGMGDLARRMPHQLSGGQQQRVSVARALASDPELVLLDEPFAALDQSLRDRLRHDIRGILRSASVTSILVTHDRAEALSLADQIAVMREGRIVQVGSPRHVYNEPVDAGVAAVLGDVTVLELVASEPRVGDAERLPTDDVTPENAMTPLGCVLLQRPVGDNDRVVVRPEQVHVQPFDPASTTAQGVITSVEYFGHDSRLEIEVQTAGGTISLLARASGDDDSAEGDKINVSLPGPLWPVGP